MGWLALDSNSQMFRHLFLGCLLTQAAFSFSTQAEEVDSQLVTALDISSSMNVKEFQIEIEGLIEAIKAPRLLDEIQKGKNKKIGFTVFLWDTDIDPCVNWTVLSGIMDAERISVRLEQCLAKYGANERFKSTDISKAMMYANQLFKDSPYNSKRRVLNIVGDGHDNNGLPGELPLAKDLLLSQNIIINALLTEQRDESKVDLLAYFQANVVGGAGHFVFNVSNKEQIALDFIRKFLMDIS